MKIPMNFPDAERHVASLGLSITDAVAEAGADAERTLLCLREATGYAHVLARFLDNVTAAVAGEIVIEDDTDRQLEMRAALAAAAVLESKKVTPINRIERELAAWTPEGAA